MSGVVIDSIHYLLTQGDSVVPIREGDFATPGTASDLSPSLQLPIGAGCELSFSTASVDPSAKITCGGAFGPSTVEPSVVTQFNVPIACHETKDGPLWRERAGAR